MAIFRVSAANDGTPIVDAKWSANWYYYQASNIGMYDVLIGPNDDFWCSAPNYTTLYGNTGTTGTDSSAGVVAGSPLYVIGLSYTGGWPQTY